MTRQETIEQLQDWVEKNIIITDNQLKLEIKQSEYPDLDWFDDILSGLEWNCCDGCGALYPSEMLYWENCDWGYESEELCKGITEEGGEYVALCDECVKKLVEKGAKSGARV